MSLREIRRRRSFPNSEYPFNTDIVRNFNSLSIESPVTIIAGDNGCGKTTLLEGVAAAAECILISGEPMEREQRFSPAFALADELKLTWSVKTRNGFFFRAADYVTYTRNLALIKEEAKEKVEEIRARDPFSLEVLPYARTYHDLHMLYGDGLDKLSHGESFLQLFQARFRPGGFYILDEPEAPLSPQRQLSLLALIHDFVGDGATFLISTHSPILMAYPGADLYEVKDGQLQSVRYEDMEHVSLTKNFLNEPERYLRYLLES
ncbi:ABC transporter ATP-binding protein [Sporosarcina sp. NCCP-2222]|uniref:AAA family ATPase n=1 Tax=Sporosarcina sp. NCCP-2222 TaxID=2935073 RepID=UPI00208C53FC|nr:AAA family ATPase [Sporosarcina sp. NCCP-2222]GKV54866.1 ABC transporter ATP-binding protein [Sporosarcina sp. NCCP-2222]